MTPSFHPDTLVIRTLVNESTDPKCIVFAFAYWEMTGIEGRKYTRRFLFSEPLTDEEHERFPRMLKFEPMTRPAREAIDILRKANGHSKINWRHWYLANPAVAESAPPERSPKPRRRHSGSGQVQCDICAPLRCVRAK